MVASADKKNVGIIAGGGKLPFIISESASRAGFNVVIAGQEKYVDSELENTADTFAVFSAGRLQDSLDFFKQNSVSHVLLSGQIDHAEVFKEHNFDPLMISILQGGDNRAEALIGRIVAAIEKQGFIVESVKDYCGSHLVQEGPLNAHAPTEEQLLDIDFGWPLAEKLAELNIGQSLMIRKQVVIAVEALEGTDGMIRRTADFGISGATVIKLPLARKNPRFDLPVIGSKTIESMIAANASVLAVSAENTIMIDPDEMKRLADQAGIAIIAR